MIPLDLDAGDRARWLLEAASSRAEIESASAGAGSVVVPAPVVRLLPDVRRRRGRGRRESPEAAAGWRRVGDLRSLLWILFVVVSSAGSAEATPRPGDRAAVASVETEGRPAPATPPQAMARLAPDGKARIDVNVASVEELCRLPGIGPRKAEAIAALRDKRRVTRPTQLLLVKGIGKKTLEKMLPYLVFPESARARGRRARDVERVTAPFERAPPASPAASPPASPASPLSTSTNPEALADLTTPVD